MWLDAKRNKSSRKWVSESPTVLHVKCTFAWLVVYCPHSVRDCLPYLCQVWGHILKSLQFVGGEIGSFFSLALLWSISHPLYIPWDVYYINTHWMETICGYASMRLKWLSGGSFQCHVWRYGHKHCTCQLPLVMWNGHNQDFIWLIRLRDNWNAFLNIVEWKYICLQSFNKGIISY